MDGATASKRAFAEAIAEGYATDGPAIELGRGVHEGKLYGDAPVRIPLALMDHIPVPWGMGRSHRRAPAPSSAGGIGDFLRSRQGQRLQRQVLRCVFGMLRKRL